MHVVARHILFVIEIIYLLFTCFLVLSIASISSAIGFLKLFTLYYYTVLINNKTTKTYNDREKSVSNWNAQVFDWVGTDRKWWTRITDKFGLSRLNNLLLQFLTTITTIFCFCSIFGNNILVGNEYCWLLSH